MSARATFWTQVTPGSRYWRCEVPARQLPGNVVSFLLSDLIMDGEQVSFPRQEGTAIWQFPGNSTTAILTAAMQDAGIRVLVEVDDCYLMPAPSIPGWERSWKWKMDREIDFFSKQVHRKIVAYADGVVVSTAELASAYKRFNPNVFVCPNSVDPDDWPEPEKPNDGKLRIGYSGSQSHWHDVAVTRRAFNWLDNQEEVELVFLGMYHPSWNLKNVKFVEWVEDLETYRKNLGLIDVGLCPLQDGVWQRCKSDIKAVEYTMGGNAVSIVQKHEAYRPWWEKEMPCLVANTEKQFLNAVKWCVKHRDELPQIAGEAKEYVLKERTIEKNIWYWEEACDGSEDSRVSVG